MENVDKHQTSSACSDLDGFLNDWCLLWKAHCKNTFADFGMKGQPHHDPCVSSPVKSYIMMRGPGGAVAGEKGTREVHVLITHRDSFVMWKKHKGQKLFDHFHLFVCLWFFLGCKWEFECCLFV